MKITIFEWRKAKGMTLEEAAAACGVHPNSIVNWEKDPDKITVGNVRKLAGALGLSMDDIFLGEPIPKVEKKKKK